jgi:transposase
MVKVRNTTTDNRVKMLVLHQEGYSSREIAVRLKCSHCTVTRLIKKYKECGQLKDRKRSGRPRQSNEAQDRMLRRASLANRKLTSPELAAKWRESCTVNASLSTVRRRLLSTSVICTQRVSSCKKTVADCCAKKKQSTVGKEVQIMDA